MSNMIRVALVHQVHAEKVAECLRCYCGSENIKVEGSGNTRSISVPEDEFTITQANRLRLFCTGVIYGLTYEK